MEINVREEDSMAMEQQKNAHQILNLQNCLRIGTINYYRREEHLRPLFPLLRGPAPPPAPLLPFPLHSPLLPFPLHSPLLLLFTTVYLMLNNKNKCRKND
jgi:hypothetical protein